MMRADRPPSIERIGVALSVLWVVAVPTRLSILSTELRLHTETPRRAELMQPLGPGASRVEQN